MSRGLSVVVIGDCSSGIAAIASAMGSYLFFAQHSFKRMHVLSPEAWTYYRAALESSSYMRLNKLMQWFTGNIGFHHIHHLSSRIPNYNLEKCYNENEEFQHIKPVTLLKSLKSLRYRLYDESRRKLVGFRAAKMASQ